MRTTPTPIGPCLPEGGTKWGAVGRRLDRSARGLGREAGR
jgi:hypothetical protein